MYLSVVFFIIAFSFVSCDGELTYPEGWDTASGSLEDFRVGNQFVIDPWIYKHRLSMYKIILQNTEPAMRQFGPNNSGNILWGLTLQFGWQFSSGRTRDLSNSTNCGFPSSASCLSPKSWWASMNYYLSVIPFLGFIQSGFLNINPSSVIIRNSYIDPHLYCLNMTSCNKMGFNLVDRWLKLFLKMRNTDNKSGTEPSLETKYLRLMWEAHINSVSIGVNIFNPRLQYMSSTEGSFGLNWANVVSYIAATLFITDNYNTATNQLKFLPPRLLWNSDKPPNAPGLTNDENQALAVLSLLQRANHLSGGNLLSFWEQTMCSPETRHLGREILETIITHRLRAIAKLIQLMGTAIGTCVQE